jgi:hypothetical protein
MRGRGEMRIKQTEYNNIEYNNIRKRVMGHHGSARLHAPPAHVTAFDKSVSLAKDVHHDAADHAFRDDVRSSVDPASTERPPCTYSLRPEMHLDLDSPRSPLEAPLDAPVSAARRVKEQPSPKPTHGLRSE